MFVDLMNDVAETFTDRFLKVQLVVEQGPPSDGRGGFANEPPVPAAPTRRYNALGVLEDVVPEAPVASGVNEVMDVGPAETPAPEQAAAARRDPVIVGAGRARSLSDATAGSAGPIDWSSVGRNDPCPCGSGKKFKKCHGATL